MAAAWRAGQPLRHRRGQGAEAESANRRYGLTISMQVRNLTNHNNPGPIIGNITSPLFGQANQPAGSGNRMFSESANNRRLELQTRFTFSGSGKHVFNDQIRHPARVGVRFHRSTSLAHRHALSQSKYGRHEYSE